MKIKFRKPLVPNFVRTMNNMIIPIQDLSEEELTEYAELFCNTLIDNYERKKGAGD